MRRTQIVGLLLVGLFVGGCMGPNLVIEGPGGELAVVLTADAAYDMFPEGGAIWILSPEGQPMHELLELREGESAAVHDWSPDGASILVIISKEGEFGFPEAWRLVSLPVDGSEPQEILASDELVSSPRYTDDGAILYVTTEDEENVLVRVDPRTGERVISAVDVALFLRAGAQTYVLGADGRLRTLDGEALPLEIRCSEASCAMDFAILGELLLACDSGGRFIALVLEDEPRLLQPEVDTVPTLYLVDLLDDSAVHIASPALSPSFAPDSSALAFVAEPLAGERGVFIYDIETQIVRSVPGATDAVWVRWGTSGILAATEQEDGTYLLLRWIDGAWTGIYPPAE